MRTMTKIMSHCCHFYCSNFSINRNIKYLNKAMFTIKFHKLHIGYIYTSKSKNENCKVNKAIGISYFAPAAPSGELHET